MKAPDLTAARAKLQQSLEDGIDAVEREQLIEALSAEHDAPQQTLRNMVAGLHDQQEQHLQLADESTALRDNIERHQLAQVLTLDYLLPAPTATALRTVTRHLPYDDPSITLAYLAGQSGLAKLGTRICGNPLTTFEVPVNLYACIVGATGAKKSPLQRLLIEAPTQPLRQELAEDHKRKVAAIKERNRGVKKPTDREPEPRELRLQIQDYTGEGLAAQLARQEEAGLGLLVARDEIAAMFKSLNAYKGGRGGDEQQLLELYDGDAFTSIRVGSDRTYSRCHLSIYGNTQPEILAELAEGGDPTGKWARFLFAPLPGRVVALPTAISAEEQEQLDHAWATLQAISRKLYTLTRRTYGLDAEALAAFSAFEADCQRQQLKANLNPHRAIHGKAAGKVLRVAGLLQLLRIAAAEEEEGSPIRLPVLQRAMAFVGFLDGWALGLHTQLAAIGEGGITGLMRKVHKSGERIGKPISWRDVRNGLSHKERKQVGRELVAKAMEHLAGLQVGEVTGEGQALRYRVTAPLPP